MDYGLLAGIRNKVPNLKVVIDMMAGGETVGD